MRRCRKGRTIGPHRPPKTCVALLKGVGRQPWLSLLEASFTLLGRDAARDFSKLCFGIVGRQSSVYMGACAASANVAPRLRRRAEPPTRGTTVIRRRWPLRWPRSVDVSRDRCRRRRRPTGSIGGRVRLQKAEKIRCQNVARNRENRLQTTLTSSRREGGFSRGRCCG